MLKTSLLELNNQTVSIKLWPHVIFEVLLVGLYLLFWLLVVFKSIEWDWLRGDPEARMVYLTWGLIIFGFCGYRLKKWITHLRLNGNEWVFRTFFSLQTTTKIRSNLIVVRKIKKGKCLIKIYSQYCDFLGQFYLEKDQIEEFFALLSEGDVEWVEDNG